MENTVLDNSAGLAPETPKLDRASHALSHKQFRAEVKDLEQVADVIHQRLEPKPPNIFQKTLRIAAYPLSLVAGYTWARTHAWEGLQKFMGDGGYLSDDKLAIPHVENAKEAGKYLGTHEAIKKSRIKNWLSPAPGRDSYIVDTQGLESEEAIKKTLDVMKEEKALPLGEKIKLAFLREKELFAFTGKDRTRAAGIVFQSIFAGGAALGLMLTLSDNKNFLNFSNEREKKKSSLNGQGGKHLTWQERHDDQASAAAMESGIS